MRRREAGKLAEVTEMTVYNWYRDGLIRAERLSNGHLDYNDEDVKAMVVRRVNARIAPTMRRRCSDGVD
jgi:predicted site-specific integrase-resolvase